MRLPISAENKRKSPQDTLTKRDTLAFSLAVNAVLTERVIHNNESIRYCWHAASGNGGFLQLGPEVCLLL